MAVRYHHTQRGTMMLVAMLVAAIVATSIGYFNPLAVARWLIWALAVAFVFLAWLFSSLTVELSENEVRWYFGPGIWRYRIARYEIDVVQIVRNNWWNGFGIRMQPGFRLYNVSGLDAVELRLKSGDSRCIGTDDARGLAAALKA